MSKKHSEAVYTFISNFIQQHGYAPNVSEIAKGRLLSERNVEEGLNWLQESGLIVRQAGRPRSIRLTSELFLQPEREENELATSLTEVIYAFIYHYIQQYRYAPTIREIMKGVNLRSTSSVIYHIGKLKVGGRIKNMPNAARTLTLTK